MARSLLQSGVTTVLTRRERANRAVATAVTLAAGVGGLYLGSRVAAWWDRLTAPRLAARPLFTGDGTLFGRAGDTPNRPQMPLYLVYPEVLNWWIAWGVAAGVVVLVAGVVVRPLFRSVEQNPRHQHLAPTRAVQREFSARAVRRAGRYTLPGTGSLHRRRLPTHAFGVNIGRATTPKAGQLWLSFDRALRIVAMPGWGKTHRLLVPIIRKLTGPALISSVEIDIFLSTVRARATRWPNGRPRRGWCRSQPNPFDPQSRGRWSRRRPERYPVWVAACGQEMQSRTAGYPQVKWNPIPGCQDLTVATRRGRALVKGVNAEDGVPSSTAAFFEHSAADVWAAWLHAAALDGRSELSDIARWFREGDLTTPARILRDHPEANPPAVLNLLKHLDPRGERTTSGVERYLVMSMASLASSVGQSTVGSRFDEQLDMEDLIREEGTLYLLAEPDEMELVRPLLSLIGTETTIAAERVARRLHPSRLPRPFMLILDELRFATRIANLPYVANVLRKFGVRYVYACTNGLDEEALYGAKDAALLRSVSTSLYGGYDEESAAEITALAGTASVVTATRGRDGGLSESEDQRDVLTSADLQRMRFGDSVIVQKGTAPFLAHTPSTYEQRSMTRRIQREVRVVLDQARA